MLVVILLDGRCEGPSNADAVASHDDGALFSLLVQEDGSEGFTVFGPQLKDVTHFNAPAE